MGKGPQVRPAAATSRPLLQAAVVLLALLLLLALAAIPLGLRPPALGVPVALLSATVLILVLLVLLAPSAHSQPEEPQAYVTPCFVPTLLVDPETGRVVAANDEAGELFGVAAVVAGGDLCELVADDANEPCRRLVQRALAEGRAEIEACGVRTSRGSVRIVRALARRMALEGRTLLVVGFLSNDASQAVSEFARVQERLMSNISHELRTPLNVVLGFSELLTTRTLGELTENQLDAAREIHIGGERILFLINDILDIGRSRSYYTPSEPRRVDPAAMLRRVEALLSGQARRDEVGLEVHTAPDLPTIEVAERPFKQLLYHLMLNAIDRSDIGDVVSVEAVCDEEFTVTVTDRGPEPAAADLEPREMAGPREEQAQEVLAPALLGLPLCATLAAQLGGRLTVRSDAEGHHFIFTMPLPHAAEGSIPPPAPRRLP